ncbi:HET-domain-containing protein [Sodiomyces alkalinus F11]|uniref:HET-domain-containing protein n=1 Tax=Sodiomyces alkalinus (strain CBS 110278 / VKM F-3762 / F11) TaxID=1314773 RepID=A0A3N2Q6Y5_SODAK|nr:HET-domain-containing protein [Sodiomyces alkalinus F11]ROT42541.1 HET-domain-containing protein [Sodiomyces alkalinus F11]
MLAAAAEGCRLCKVITQSLGFGHLESSESLEAVWYLSPLQDAESHHDSSSTCPWFRLTIDAMDEDDEIIDTENDLTDLPERCQDVDEKGHVRLPKSGADIRDPDIPSSPPAWAFTLIPATDPAVADIQYEPPSSPQDPRMWSLAKQWLEKCRSGHAKCSESRNPTFYPTRLVEIIDHSTLRVLDCNNRRPSGPYVAFSHCWGRAETLKLLEENKARLETSIDIDELPRSYKEGIEVAMRFGFRYIWIDSLCIIQDSLDDWRAEAATMKDVYNSASLTIAASAASENSEASFRRRDPAGIQHIRVNPTWNGIPKVQYVLASMDLYQDEIAHSPLRRRSWVIQEYYLSSRTLSLTRSQIWWECRETMYSESWPNGVPERLRHTVRDDQTREELHREGLQGVGGSGYGASYYHRLWYNLVEKYMSCRLTVFSDKMIAMAGLASYFQPNLGDDEYVAGHWRSQLPQSLCWDTFPYLSRPKVYRPSQYRAPSWSWASVEGDVTFQHNTHDADGSNTVHVCEVLEFKSVKAGPSPTGDLRGGYLQLRGRLFPVKIREQFLTVPDEGGDYGYIKGSAEDENRVTDGDDDTTGASLDEFTSDNWPVVSSLDTSAVDVLDNAVLDTTRRVARLAHEWDGRLFCLPLIEWVYLEKPRLRGIILGHTRGEPPSRYQRVGFFYCEGSITTSHFEGGEVEEFFVI